MNCASSMKIQKCKTEPTTLAFRTGGGVDEKILRTIPTQQPHFPLDSFRRGRLKSCISLSCLANFQTIFGGGTVSQEDVLLSTPSSTNRAWLVFWSVGGRIDSLKLVSM